MSSNISTGVSKLTQSSHVKLDMSGGPSVFDNKQDALPLHIHKKIVQGKRQAVSHKTKG